MRIIFFGSGKFAVNILKAVQQKNHEVVLVVTQPDRKKGRHLPVTATPVKEHAITAHLDIFQPENPNAPESVDELKKKNADVFVVVSYGRILSKDVLAIPSRMCLNIHASLLPKYRGAAPISWVLIDAEKKTGVTFIRMNHLMDRGDIIFQKSLAIQPDDNALTLDEKLSQLSSRYINQVLTAIERGRVRFKKQPEKQATRAPLLKKQDGLIHWNQPAPKIFNQFRGCYGWPGCFTFFNGKLLKILAMQIGQKRKPDGCLDGEIIRAQDNILEVACSEGTLVITQVLPESHHPMAVKSFLAGHKAQAGNVFGT